MIAALCHFVGNKTNANVWEIYGARIQERSLYLNVLNVLSVITCKKSKKLKYRGGRPLMYSRPSDCPTSPLSLSPSEVDVTTHSR